MSRADIILLSVAAYVADQEAYPDTLADAGYANPIDPWGYTYRYLKIATTVVAAAPGPRAVAPAPPGGLPDVAAADKDETETSDTEEGDKTQTGKPRKDRFLVPVNSDFDLYSVGKDGRTAAPFTAKMSKDDVVRAMDGGYVGLASEF